MPALAPPDRPPPLLCVAATCVEELVPLAEKLVEGSVCVVDGGDLVEAAAVVEERTASSELCHHIGTPSPRTAVSEATVYVDTEPRFQLVPRNVGLMYPTR